MNKAKIRSAHKALRQSLSQQEMERLSKDIASGFMTELEGLNWVRHIHIFLPIEKLREINTMPMVERLLEKDLRLYTSLLNRESDEMDTVEILKGQTFIQDSWGIPVPLEAEKTDPKNIELVLIPLLAFDRSGHRLGYGKGFYDRFLHSLNQDVLKVGLSFFEPIDKIPEENHDIPLDLCVTPDKAYWFTEKREDVLKKSQKKT